MSYPGETFTGKPAAFVIALIAFSTSVAGIYRHDVPEKKYLALGKQKQFDCVGRMGASCVLISDRYVLTAAHLFLEADTDTLDTMLNGKKVQIYTQSNYRVTDFSRLYATFNGRKVRVKRGIIHRSYLDSLATGGSSCDIALLELEQPVTLIKPAKLSSAFDELHSDVTGVGYGGSGRADRLESVQQRHKKIAGESVVDSTGGQEFENQKTLLFCTFVAPGDTTATRTSRPLEYICTGGDSGGGLFRQTANGWELIGICGGGGGGVDLQRLISTRSYYGQKMSWVRVSAFTGWIAEQMK